jgi:hypothetical protein
VATSAVLAGTRHMGNDTCPDFKAWPKNLKMVKKSRNLDQKKTKNEGGRGTYDRLPLLWKIAHYGLDTIVTALILCALFTSELFSEST